MIGPDRDDNGAREARERRRRDVIYAYKRLFSTPDGGVVLNDLNKSFGVEMPAFLPTSARVGGNIQYDAIYAAIRDGQRSVYQHIINAVASDIDPSGNLEQVPTVLTGLRE